MTAREKTKVLVVDDSALARKVVTAGLVASGEIDVIATAANGLAALEQLAFLQPDIVLLDMEMPVMDGFQTLKQIRKRYKTLPVVVFSTLTERGARATMDALAAGANDYMCKPTGVGALQGALEMIRDVLAPKLQSLSARRAPAGVPAAAAAQQSASSHGAPAALGVEARGAVTAIAIGCSAGGPQALELVIPALPRDLGVPVFVVQHMPAMFVTVLAGRLDAASELRVAVAGQRVVVQPNHVYLAPGDQHLELVKDAGGLRTALNVGPAENGCRPAVDRLFHSAAAAYGKGLLAIVLTGMGQDGTAGSREVRRLGGHVWVQDEASSVVWGMPGSVVKAGFAERICGLRELAPALVRAVRARPAPGRSG